MHATTTLEPWMIAELERQRRNRDAEYGERASIPLPLPAPPPRPARRPEAVEDRSGSTVVVIELW